VQRASLCAGRHSKALRYVPWRTDERVTAAQHAGVPHTPVRPRPQPPFHSADDSRQGSPSGESDALLTAVFSAMLIVLMALVAALAPPAWARLQEGEGPVGRLPSPASPMQPTAPSAVASEPGGGALLLAGCLGVGVLAHRRRQEKQ